MKDCPWCHTDPNEITALKQRVAELERELEAARKVCATATCINQGYKNGVYEIAARDKPEHELAEAFFASLDSELAAYRATKERTDG